MTKQNNKQIELRFAPSELRANSESRTIVGYAAKFDKWSEPIMGWFKEKIDRDAFSECDVTDVIMCFNHNIDSILARTTSGTLSLSTDEEGLRFEFEAPATTLGNDMVELVRRGDISKCSFKFTVEEDEWLYANEENGLDYDERIIRKIDKLYDVSLVVYPAYNDTEAGVRHLEERKQAFLNQHTSHEKTTETPTEGVAVDSTEDTTADSQVHRATPGEIHSSARTRLTQTLKLKN
jgi:HK97 family phage prohead protease